MKIVLVGPTHPFRGGISHYTTLLCQHLRKKHDVRFFTYRRQYPTWLYPGKSDRDEESQATLHVEAEPLLDGVRPLTWLQAVREIRREEPDLLILQWSVSYWIPLLALLVRGAPSRTRVVMICHNATPHEKGSRVFGQLTRALQRAIMQQSDFLLCHAESDERILQSLLPSRAITRVMLPSYQDLALLSNGGTQESKRGNPHLLFFGFVRPYKGVDVLLEAMPDILHALPDAHLTIAGEWWKMNDPARAVNPRFSGSVEIVDRYVSNEEMGELFGNADVVVLPYRSATQSAVVQLAYGFGVPVITTRVGGLPEAVRHEESGFLVPPEDAGALAQAVIRYHKEGWREKLMPGVLSARQSFSWEALVHAIERAGNG